MTIGSASSAPEAPSYGDELAEEIAELSASRTPQALDLPALRYLDRETSWLDFNARVLELAADPAVPLLERVRFLAIFCSNIDEFFMVRIAGLQRRIDGGVAVPSPAGLSPREQLEAVSLRAHELVAAQAVLFHDEILPLLRAAGIDLLRWEALSAAEQARLGSMFDEMIQPVLTPLAVDPAHPFPYISGLSLNLAVIVRDRDTGREHFARVKVPPLLPRFVPLDGERFVPLESVIAANLPRLFPGMEVVETHCFRVTRNEDVEVEEEGVEDLLTALEHELTRRRFGPPVRLEVEQDVSERVLDLLVRELQVAPRDVYPTRAPLDLTGLWPLADLDRPELKYRAAVPRVPEPLRASDGAVELFRLLRERDLLVQHPYDSFAASVQAFVEQASLDPAVLAIKQTLYRTSGDSPIVAALIRAAQAGKQVLVLVEIKARFDEEANIRWARALEQAGCHVVYGLVGLKTHCKLSLAVRHEEDGSLRRYAHIGTGNYNPKTARLYEDFGLLTADPEVCEDVADLFNHLSGYTKPKDYSTLLVAPDSLRSGLIAAIDREREHALAGRPAGLRIKVNSLVDEEVIDALYRASRAGVPIEAVVRGMCSLRPEVPGLSENIRVRSILGRFLEHSRVVHARNAGADAVWLGSADVMHRNLDRRVEVLVEVRDPDVRRRILQVLDLATSDRIARWELRADGEWERCTRDAGGQALLDYQEQLLEGVVDA